MSGRYSARGVDKDPGWVERRFREQDQRLAELSSGKLSAVPGSVVTIQQLLTDPASPIAFVNTDTTTVATTGDVAVLLSHIPMPGSTHVYWNGLEVSPTTWSRTGQVLTVTDPGVRVGDVFDVAYAYDTVSANDPTAANTSYLDLVHALGPLWFARLNEASGTTMTDYSGSARDGTYTDVTLGAAGIVPTLDDTATSFVSATPSYATVSHAAWMDVGTIGLVAWVRPASIAFFHSIIDRDHLVNGRSWQFRKNSDGEVEFLFWTTSGGPYTCTGATVLDDQSTYMVGASFDGTTAKVFVNGVEDGSLSQSGTLENTGTADLTVGASRSGTAGAIAQPFSGDIQAGAMFTTLNDEDFAVLYAAGSGT